MQHFRQFLALFLITCANLFAQSVEFGGIVFDEAAYISLNQKSLYNPQNRLLNLYDRNNVLAADINTGVNFTSWLTVHSSLQAAITSARDTESKFSLRELFVRFSPKSALDFTLGRTILKWGTGYAYNPTGVIEPRRDPSDPSDRLRRYRGLDLAQADFYYRSSLLTLVYLNTLETDGRWQMANDHRLAMRVYTLFRGFDVSVIGFWEEHRRGKIGFNFTKVIGEALEVHGEFLGQRGCDMPTHLIATVNFPDTLFRFPPFAPIHQHEHRLFGKYLAGFQYTFGKNINLAMEYFHNDEGMSSADWQRFLDYLVFANRQLVGPQGNLATANLLWSTGVLSATGSTQDYLFARLYFPDLITAKVSGELLALENLHDGSAVVIPNLSIYLGHEISAYLRWSGFSGKRESEFGGLFYRSVTNLGMSWKF
ncbi:MAG: hypothetical protein ONB44_07225 [candidate division KSB1 bacterium]|nr:hypothetical protein [candidate division KSB1 bacterium]MDZ7301917.1 hypothetical protein [candidate division KSB1 bacterium]MDZ7314252.1 hypothetical protein [candidate division KSB1 bacterium]